MNKTKWHTIKEEFTIYKKISLQIKKEQTNNNNIFINKIKWHTIQAEFTKYVKKYHYKVNKKAH